MNLFNVVLETTTASSDATAAISGLGIGGMLLYVLVIGVIFYFLLIRPQKKQQKQMDDMQAGVKAGDNIMTTGGFYGVVLDVVDDTVIVEFGNNKNCRIPMHKKAIAEVERPGEASEDSDKGSKK